MSKSIVRACIACGEDMLIPFVGIKNPRPSSRVPLCDRPECLRDRGIRQAQASVVIEAEFRDKMAAAQRQVQGHGVAEKPVIEVETSKGTQIHQVRADDLVEDLEDIEKIKAREMLEERDKRDKGKKPNSVASPNPERPKQPSYLKSVAQSVVPSADPLAPYGRDENDRPIGVPDMTPANPNGWSASQPTKPPIVAPIGPVATYTREKRDETGKLLEQDDDYLKEREVSQAEAFFGLTPKRTMMPQKQSRHIHSFRELLVMDRFEVAALFDAVVAVRWSPTGEKVLMDKTVVKKQATDLKKEIDELRQLLVTRTAQWQKINRPDDILDKNARDRLKREETKLLHQKEAEWRTLRSRLLHWEADPRNWVDAGKKEPVFITFAEKYPITFVNIKTDNGRWLENETAADEFGCARVGNDYDLDGYLKFLGLGFDTLTMMANGMSWEGWREWENLVITQAITLRLIEPDEDLIELYPGLGRFIPPYNPHEGGDGGAMENQLALKTGGAQYNGSIYGAGKRIGKHRNYARRIEDFTKTMEYGSESLEHDDGSRSFVPDNSDDREGWDPD